MEGNVYSEIACRLLKPRLDKDGYLGVILYKNGGYRNKKVHRLVAETFIPNPDKLPQVNHLDEDKSNNNMSNLVWSSALHNVEHTKCKVEHVLYRNGVEYRFNNISQFSRENDLHKGDVSKVLNHKLKTVKGFSLTNSGV